MQYTGKGHLNFDFPVDPAWVFQQTPYDEPQKGKGKGKGSHDHIKGFKGKGTQDEGKGKATGPQEHISRRDDPLIREVGRISNAFMKEVKAEIFSRMGGTLEEYIAPWFNVPHNWALYFAQHSRTRAKGEGKDSLKGKVTQEDETRIRDEWTECILRQLLMLRSGIFRDDKWHKWTNDLLISHTGHMLHPVSRIVVWVHHGPKRPSMSLEI
jgi:hypothetical protein